MGGQTSRSFDMNVRKLKDDESFNFAGIDKEEQKNLTNYLKSKNVKMRTVDVETNQQIDLSDEDEVDVEEESKGAEKASKRSKRAAGGNTAMLDDDYGSEEDDEDFNEEESPDESGSEEGSEEDDDDMDVDEEID